MGVHENSAHPPFSVLMSLYIKEKPEYFCDSMDSVLSQNVLPSEIVIVKDGPLSDELEAALAQYEDKNPGLIKTVPLEKNMGLGLALSFGIQACSNELIARMDTDDIAVPYRFEVQLRQFVENPKLDICGSHIKEFADDPQHVVAERIVPLDDAAIKAYQRKRDSFNHMTVMYRRSSVLAAGNYRHAPLMEDTLLWVSMMLNDCECMNVDDYLVLARAGDDMIERRGGFSYFKKYREGRKCILATGYISYFDYFETIAAQFVVALIPLKLRTLVFRKLLRS